MDKPARPFSRKVKLVAFIFLVVMAAVFSILLKLMFPDHTAAAIVIESASEAAMGSDATSAAVSADGSAVITEATRDLIPIYLVGAVRIPGVYLVERGSYLFELVERAGGLLDNAASEAINLAFCLEANQRIWLPTRQEANAEPAGAMGGTGGTEWPGGQASTKIDINLADEVELDSLPGIGPTTAATIVTFRQSHGRFEKVEDLMKVPGIKESRFERVKDFICVTGRQ